MNVTLEQIERLQQHAGVSFEEARAALEASGGDLLDALVWLERGGKIDSSGVRSYATDNSGWGEPIQEPEPLRAERGNILRTVWRWLVDNRLEVCRRADNAVALEIPVVALIALLALAWWLVLILLGAGFLFGYRYRLAGPHLGRSAAVQDVMDQIDDNMESVVDQMKRGLGRRD